MTKELFAIEYIDPEDLINIVDIIRGFEYEHEEEVPDYDGERNAIDEYFALIDRLKTSYYPNIFDKASYLFIKRQHPAVSAAGRGSQI